MKDLMDFGPDDCDQKKHFNKLKHDLEGWREVLVHGSAILKWEKHFYPGITCGAVTFVYLMLWWMQLSVLTTVALFGLLVCAGDYLLPIVLKKFVFKPEQWTGMQEKQYDEVCREIFNVQVNLWNCWVRFRMAKEQKSTMFVVLVSSVLLFLAWIGSSMNNMFLCYLLTLALVNYPGLCNYGIVDKVKSLVGSQASTVIGAISGACKKNE